MRTLVALTWLCGLALLGLALSSGRLATWLTFVVVSANAATTTYSVRAVRQARQIQKDTRQIQAMARELMIRRDE